MAGEIGHVVYGAQVLDSLGEPRENPVFWAGTLFPDIGHIGAPSRHRTHPKNVSVKNMHGHNDFGTGLRVHSWIDATRETYLKEHNIKEQLFWHPFVPHALKLLEDELVYDTFDDWNLIQRTLNKIYEDERTYVHDQAIILEWHSLLQAYFRQRPNDETRYQLSRAIGLSENSATEINSVVRRLKETPLAEKMIKKFPSHMKRALH